MKVLGIDPGSRILGFGLVELHGGQLHHLDHGVINVSRYSRFSERLAAISNALCELFDSHHPDVVSLEKIFLAKNVDSAFKLGHARGICVLEAAKRKIPIFEYEPRVIKKGITGSGAAEKEQVRLLVLAMLGISSDQALDATDALAMAIHHLRMGETREHFQRLKIDPPTDLGEAL